MGNINNVIWHCTCVLLLGGSHRGGHGFGACIVHGFNQHAEVQSRSLTKGIELKLCSLVIKQLRTYSNSLLLGS